MRDICLNYRITDEENRELDKKFGKLCYFIAHQLKKKNSQNHYTDDIEDICQELQFAIIRAGSYYKRQVYTEKCLSAAGQHARDDFLRAMIASLEDLWRNRTRHGAHKQKYGPYQEELLEKIVQAVVPEENRPRKDDPLKLDHKFATYCKAIVWNCQKSMGKKITKKKALLNGLVSLSEYTNLL